jgi:sugar O-acyltransferase (sialic acid O-acetyltransferase NeuD family)
MSESLKELYIIGASGFGREVADTVHAINKISYTYKIVGFLDDNDELHGSVINDIPVLGGVDYLKEIVDSVKKSKPFAVIAIADPQIKEYIADKLNGFVTWESIVHPTSIISNYAYIGEGNIIQANTVIGPNAHISNHCIVNLFSSVAHDVKMDDFVSVMVHCDITGNVHVEKSVYIGSSVSIVPGKKIGQGSFLCAGSVVLSDVDANTKVIGYPAKTKN